MPRWVALLAIAVILQSFRVDLAAIDGFYPQKLLWLHCAEAKRLPNCAEQYFLTLGVRRRFGETGMEKAGEGNLSGLFITNCGTDGGPFRFDENVNWPN